MTRAWNAVRPVSGGLRRRTGTLSRVDRALALARARVVCLCSGCKIERLTRLATAWNRVRRGCVGSGKAAEKSAKPQSVSKSNNLKVVAKRDKGLIGTHKKLIAWKEEAHVDGWRREKPINDRGRRVSYDVARRRTFHKEIGRYSGFSLPVDNTKSVIQRVVAEVTPMIYFSIVACIV